MATPSEAGRRRAGDHPKHAEGNSGFTVAVQAPRLVPITAEQHAAARALLAELIDQWQRGRA